MADQFSIRNEIPEVNMQRLTDLLERLNKRADVVGTLPIVMQIHGTETREWDKETGAMMQWHDVEVLGEAPVIEGYQLVAVLDHTYGEENMIRRVPRSDEIEIPEHYRTADADCDHCGYDRVRNETFLLYGDDYIQVGRNCLKDFGANEGMIRRIEFMDRVFDEVAEAMKIDEPTSIRPSIYDTHKYLSHVTAVIEQHGWLSKGKAYDQGRFHQATANIAADIMIFDSDELEISEQDEQVATSALEWIRDKNHDADLSDYEWNLMIACQRDVARPKDFGIVASLIPAYYRATGHWTMNGKVKDKDQPVSEWVGEVGERETFELTVQMAKPVDSYYGKSTLYLMADADGNIFKWFTTSQPVKREMYLEYIDHPEPEQVAIREEFEMEVGWTYQITGTIKDHDEFNGTKQTGLSRCKIDAIVTHEDQTEGQ